MKVTIEVKAKAGKFKELLQTIEMIVPIMRKEKGCRCSRVYRDMEDGETFLISCDWEAADDLKSYFRSSRGSALIGAIDLLGQPADVTYGRSRLRRGVEALVADERRGSKTLR